MRYLTKVVLMQTGDVLYFGSGTEGRLPYRQSSQALHFFWGGGCWQSDLLPKKVGEKMIMISLHSDVVNLVSQCDLLGWLCCQECLRWSAGGCGITYVVEATWSQSQGDGHLHRLRMANGWTDGTVPHWRKEASFKLTLTPSPWSMHILDGSWWGFWRQKVRYSKLNKHWLRRNETLSCHGAENYLLYLHSLFFTNCDFR